MQNHILQCSEGEQLCPVYGLSDDCYGVQGILCSTLISIENNPPINKLSQLGKYQWTQVN